MLVPLAISKGLKQTDRQSILDMPVSLAILKSVTGVTPYFYMNIYISYRYKECQLLISVMGFTIYVRYQNDGG